MKKIETHKLTTKDGVITEALVKINEIIDCLNEKEDRKPEHRQLDKMLGINQTKEKNIKYVGGCCEKCDIYLDYKDAHQCNDAECECHTQQEVGDWKDEFGTLPLSGLTHAEYKILKSFITTLLANKKAEVENWISKNEYCAKCCLPKKFCQDWGKYPSIINTKDFKLFINKTL